MVGSQLCDQRESFGVALGQLQRQDFEDSVGVVAGFDRQQPLDQGQRFFGTSLPDHTDTSQLFARRTVAVRALQHLIERRSFCQIVAVAQRNRGQQGESGHVIGPLAQALPHQSFRGVQAALIEGGIGVGKIRRIGREPSVADVG